MDIFRFDTGPNILNAVNGEIVNNAAQIMWVERYREPGEFSITAPVSSNLKTILPIGCLISHVDSSAIMIVEDHQIKDEQDKESDIVITGRSFESFLEQRVVGANFSWDIPSATDPNTILEEVTDYILGAVSIQSQTLVLLSSHTLAGHGGDAKQTIPNLTILKSGSFSTNPVEERIVSRGPLLTKALEILALGDLGLTAYRPGRFTDPSDPTNNDIILVIHEGVDRSSTVVFSYDTGEVVSGQYLWSNRKKKTSAYVYGQYLHSYVGTSGLSGFDNRVLVVEASDIDSRYSAIPVSNTTREWVRLRMRSRGYEALKAYNDINLVQAEITKLEEGQSVSYRKDYNVGDIVTVTGNYNEAAKMRIVEYVEISDETGAYGYPMLAPPLEN